VLRWYRDFLPAQHEDLYGFFATMTIPPGDPFPADLHLQKACGIVCASREIRPTPTRRSRRCASSPRSGRASARCPIRR